MKYNIYKEKCRERGFMVSVITVFTLVIMLSVALSMASLIFYRQNISTHSIKSTQGYYAAEAGIEDALLKLNNNPSLAPTSYSVIIGASNATITIPETIGGSRAIISRGDYSGIIRKIETVYSMDGEGISFNYGAQVGAGGLQMSNGSAVKGNVFSNGNITGSGTIDNNVIVAGNGNKIDGPRVKGNVLSHTCRTSIVDGNLTYVTGGVNTCNVAGTTQTQSSQIPSQSLPISPDQINGWKTEAAANVITGNVTISNGATQLLGPAKITGNLTLSNNATLKLTGTVYVVGNIVTSNASVIKLNSSYGSLSGVILADGTINFSNNSVLLGSGQSGSYILVLSTSSSSSAIVLSNNTNGGIHYTSAGGINVSNNANVKELVGYRIMLSNNAIIQYETGLQNAFFSNGPSGGWQVTSWQEK